MPKGVYIYYSGATDKTGGLLAEALEIQGGREKPKGAQQIVIGWGAKTKDACNLGKAAVLNHPDSIRANRNKFTALQIMAAANVNVAPFIGVEGIQAEMDKKKSLVTLPLIARTNYHQGGANFFTCLTRTHINETIGILNNKLKKKGYFQDYIDVKSEFRLHIVNGEVIYAQRKVPRDNLKQAHVTDQMDKIKRMAEKKGVTMDEASLKFAMEYQGDKIAGQDLIVKSNSRGYKFSSVKDTNINKALAAEAIKAVTALGLQFGAVDCVMDTNDKPWIIEVNTGPGLEGTSFKRYVGAFSKAINEILTPKKTVTKATTAGKAAPTTLKKAVGDEASNIDPAKLRMLADMLDGASADEKAAVLSTASRMFGNG
jgi:glutathione synthase/RimK-type ligase-like ATP-grasp enzyme